MGVVGRGKIFENGELAANFVRGEVTDLGQCGLLVFEDELSGIVGGKLDDDRGSGGVQGNCRYLSVANEWV